MTAPDTNAEYYGSLKPGRDDYWRFMAAPRFRVSRILELLSAKPPRTVTDLGCGNGALLAEIAAAFPEASLTGVDLSPAQIEENQKHSPTIHWLTADLQQNLDPAMTQQRFDTIIATEIVEHVHDPLMLLRNAALLAEPHARLLLTTQSGRVGETERQVGHVRHFTRDEMTNLLTEAGWRPVRVWNEGFPFHDLSKRLANLRPGASMNYFGERRYGPMQRLTCLGLRAAFAFNSRRSGAQLFAVAERPSS